MGAVFRLNFSGSAGNDGRQNSFSWFNMVVWLPIFWAIRANSAKAIITTQIGPNGGTQINGFQGRNSWANAHLGPAYKNYRNWKNEFQAQNSWESECLAQNSWANACLAQNSWVNVCLAQNSWESECLVQNFWANACLDQNSWANECLAQNSWVNACLDQNFWAKDLTPR